LSAEGYDLLSAAVDYALGMTTQARNPNPPDGAENVSQSTLQWSAGYTAMWHNVYFGTNPTPGATELVSEQQTETMYQPPEGLASNTTYYWRIDEIEADGTTIHTGAVWSFTTAILAASNPDPLDGAIEVDTSLSIRWTAGYGAVTHNVYLGSNEAAVANATTSSPEFKGNQPATTYGRGTLAKDATYYWRIDEVEEDGTTTHKGDVWSFTTKIFAPVVIERHISWTSDDIEEEVPGGDMVGMGDSDLEMPYQDEGKVGEQIIGIRFEDITVPKNSIISEAWVRFDVDETKDGTLPVSLIIEGELSPNAVTFSEIDFNISNRPRTKAQVVWEPEDWIATHQKHNTSNITPIIQEIIDHKDWTIGNALVLIISDNPANPSQGTRCAESWNGAGSNPDQIPLLHIEFTTKQAVQPNPVDGFIYPDNRVSLSWMPGDTAVSHNVYLGDNFVDVETGTGGTALGSTTETYYDIGLGMPGDPYPDGLSPGTTYYWRIDEVEADGTTTHKGDVWSFTIPTRTAYNPAPSDRARFVDPNVTLSWEQGSNAITHDVYFGKNFTEVNDGTGDTSKGTLTETIYTPGPLEKDTTYYWRIDEFDGSETNKGDVWRFRTMPDIAISDPNLIGWWKLDDGSGTTALDSSGHGNHGTLGNNPQWIFGYDGGAIEFDGTNYIDLPTGLIGTDKGTVCMWIKTTQGTQGHIFYGSEGTSGDGFGGQNEFHVNIGSSGQVEFFLEGGDAGDVRVRTSSINNDTWLHVAATWDINSDMMIYLNGGTPVSNSHNGNNFNLAGRIRLGRPNDYERYYSGSLDDLRLYDYVLTQEEIAETMKGDTRLASDPSPAHESIVDKEHAKPLRWSPGENTAQHDVYLSTDIDAVADADASDTSGIYRGRQDLGNESYTPTEVFEFNQTYYWRIDEYHNDATIGKGSIWTFTIADYLIIDDFEDYTNYQPDDIFSTWSDGYNIDENGALVGHDEPDFVETEIVHSGEQSMPFFYDNSGTAKYSEASRAISGSKDWTREGVTELSLWFKGHPAYVGSFTEAPVGTYTIMASGADIWDSSDEFHFAYKQYSGTGVIIAKVESVQNTDEFAKAGVMIRDTLDPDSINTALLITPENGIRFQYRQATGGNTDREFVEGITAPHWVKLERTIGGLVRAYHSADGTTWEQLPMKTVTMSTPLYIGLAVTSHNAELTCEAKFSNVSFPDTNVDSQWTDQDIGITSNYPEPMYVAVSNSNGTPTAVYHDNPDAALIDTWTEWTIDLKLFEDQGIDLTDVDKIYLGLGDKNNPQPGGLGTMFFDDIRLYRPRIYVGE
jgi:hypothetical protein